MPNYKVVDADQLDADMATVADAIRSKAGTEDALSFPDGFVSAVDEIPEPEKAYADGYAEGYENGYAEATEIKFVNNGMAYVEIKSVTVPYVGLGENHPVFCADTTHRHWGAQVFNQYGVLEGYAPEAVHSAGHYPFTSNGNPLLRKIVAPKMKKIDGGYWGRNLKALEFLQLGSIGHAVERLKADSLGLRDTTDKLTIEVYVDAQTLADISPDITSQAPWCATSATIIYRNSTTGEVITE